MVSAKPKRRDRKSIFLRQWRKYRGLTQIEASERIEVNQSTLARIESGELPYNEDVLERLALAYGCDPYDLLCVDPTKPDPPKLVIDRLRQAPPEVRDRALAVLEALLKAG